MYVKADIPDMYLYYFPCSISQGMKYWNVKCIAMYMYIHKSWHEGKKNDFNKHDFFLQYNWQEKKFFFLTFKCAKLDPYTHFMCTHVYTYEIPFICLFMVTTFYDYAPLIPPKNNNNLTYKWSKESSLHLKIKYGKFILFFCFKLIWLNTTCLVIHHWTLSFLTTKKKNKRLGMLIVLVTLCCSPFKTFRNWL